MANSIKIMYSNMSPGFFTHAKRHGYDWLMILCLIIIDGLLQLIHPYERYVDKFDLQSLTYPLMKNTIPTVTVPIFALVFPFTIIFVVWLIQSDRHDLHHAILGLLASVFLTAVIADSVKVAVGRLRPDFFYRCFPNGTIPKELPVGSFRANGDVLCNGKASVIQEGRKSFPSGHASWAFSGLTYLSLYLAGKLHVFNGEGRVWKLVPAVAPVFVATLVCISRVNDYWHHWQDVTVGGLLGLSVAVCIYHQHFPWLTAEGVPRPQTASSGGHGGWREVKEGEEGQLEEEDLGHGVSLQGATTNDGTCAPSDADGSDEDSVQLVDLNFK